MRSPRTGLTRPLPGSRRPARIEISVDFPPPLRPTTPTRSPASTPSETPSSTGFGPPNAMATFSRLTRLATVLFLGSGVHLGPGVAGSRSTPPGAARRAGGAPADDAGAERRAVRHAHRAAHPGPGELGRHPDRGRAV